MGYGIYEMLTIFHAHPPIVARERLFVVLKERRGVQTAVGDDDAGKSATTTGAVRTRRLTPATWQT
jgi:hypothetical protein